MDEKELQKRNMDFKEGYDNGYKDGYSKGLEAALPDGAVDKLLKAPTVIVVNKNNESENLIKSELFDWMVKHKAEVSKEHKIGEKWTK